MDFVGESDVRCLKVMFCLGLQVEDVSSRCMYVCEH